MQVESIALSRDVPAILASFVSPLIRRGEPARSAPSRRRQDIPRRFAITI